ncbi:MAG: type I restriction-modification system subunit M [Bacteroidales bacterium]|nr:type I restriction-modification system subunit M [Bacteroidales bacterium]
MSDNNQNKLGDILWAVANDLRGSMNADSFRDYMLSFLFLYNISWRYREAVKKELGKEYDTESPTPLLDWYEKNPDVIEEFEKQMRRKVHYVIEPKYLWDNIRKLASKQSEDLLSTLSEGFKKIENDAFGNTFEGLFSEIHLDSDKLGKNPTERNLLLCKIINTIANKLEEFTETTDALGDAYEYVIGKFAASAGQKAGEFYTPQQISNILSQIVVLDCQDPKSNDKPKKALKNVLDFACGSGSLLLNVKKTMGTYGIGKIYGQEKNITTYNLARMNMLLHGVKDTEFEIYHGDTLVNDWKVLKEEIPGSHIKFDAVVANPPFSLRWEPGEKEEKDFRFSRYGVAPKSAADFAFLLHGFHYLNDEGTMAIILPHGVLFRSGKEEAIRTKLINDDIIDTIIGLPPNLFYSTGIPVCILVLKKCRRTDDVLFINASSKEHYRPIKRQNVLRDNDVKMIVDTYRERAEIERYSRRVSLQEIKENGYNLNITRYVNLSVEEISVDLSKVQKELKNIDLEIEKFRAEHNSFLRELGLEEI